MADENKFINATAFDKTLCNMIRNICAGGGGSQVADGVCLALAQLRAAPAADVTEVVHGKWIKGKYPGEYTCSRCGMEYCEADSADKPFNYCPECGSQNE